MRNVRPQRGQGWVPLYVQGRGSARARSCRSIQNRCRKTRGSIPGPRPARAGGMGSTGGGGGGGGGKGGAGTGSAIGQSPPVRSMTPSAPTAQATSSVPPSHGACDSQLPAEVGCHVGPHPRLRLPQPVSHDEARISMLTEGVRRPTPAQRVPGEAIPQLLPGKLLEALLKPLLEALVVAETTARSRQHEPVIPCGQQERGVGREGALVQTTHVALKRVADVHARFRHPNHYHFVPESVRVVLHRLDEERHVGTFNH
mmetsp:Transcript_11014/g.22158  ORF Transcript_11014/g.22158 Transcript_11014/m.22158 type:complete len:257 (-) Transcript_11014:385-1155(-)